MDISREWLFEQYVTNGVSAESLRQSLGLSKSSFCRLLRRLDVSKNRSKKRYEVSREWLEKRYLVDLLGVEAIASEVGCSVEHIKDLCSVYGLKRGSSYIKSSDGRRRFSKPHSEEAKAKMSAAKSKNERTVASPYRRGKYGLRYRDCVHRRIAEESLGPLGKDEVVHHMDCDKDNHHPNNLLVMYRDVHQALHIFMRRSPELDQIAWLEMNNMKYRRVSDGNYKESDTFKRWFDACAS